MEVTLKSGLKQQVGGLLEAVLRANTTRADRWAITLNFSNWSLAAIELSGTDELHCSWPRLVISRGRANRGYGRTRTTVAETKDLVRQAAEIKADAARLFSLGYSHKDLGFKTAEDEGWSNFFKLELARKLPAPSKVF